MKQAAQAAAILKRIVTNGLHPRWFGKKRRFAMLFAADKTTAPLAFQAILPCLTAISREAATEGLIMAPTAPAELDRVAVGVDAANLGGAGDEAADGGRR